MDKNLLNAINRLRGVALQETTETPKEESIKEETVGIKSQALKNLLAQAPDETPPESEKKYTMEDLDKFIESLVKPE